MEGLSFEQGIFIHSENLESKFMVESLQVLIQTCPAIKITLVECEERIGGFKVCIADSKARSILEKRYLMILDQRISLYPLGSYLLVHGIHTRGNSEIERDLTDTIQEKFGKVLDLQKLSDHSSEKTANSYLVLIDIPEIPSLSVFSRNGYPRMSMTVPNMCKTFKVTFWCRRCKSHGHSYQECFGKLQNSHKEANSKQTVPSSGRAENKPQEVKKNASRKSSVKPTSLKCRIRMDAARSFNFGKKGVKLPQDLSFLEPTDSFANKLGIEEVLKANLSTGTITSEQGVQNSSMNSLLMESLALSRQIKEMNANTPRRKVILNNESSKKNELIPRTDTLTGQNSPFNREIKQETDDHKGQFSVRKSVEEQPQNNSTCAFPADATSTTNTDNEIQITYETLGSDGYKKNWDASSEGKILLLKQNWDASPEASTSYLDGIKEEPLSTEHLAGDSYQSLPVTPQPFNFPTDWRQSGPSTSCTSPQHQVTGSLSERLQSCINDAYRVHSILDAKILNAFLTHVKKKSNPIRVAGNYTTNAQGLKDQLKQIVFFYYNTPQTGTKEDIQFIKWLNGLIERFDCTAPRKRKSGGKSPDVAPAKK